VCALFGSGVWIPIVVRRLGCVCPSRFGRRNLIRRYWFLFFGGPGLVVRAPRFEPPFRASQTTEWNRTYPVMSPTTDDTTSDTDPHRPRHVLIPVGRSAHATLRIHPRIYSKKYMRKRVYRYVRYYLEIPKRIAESSLGIQLEARRLPECIVIAPAERSDFFSTLEEHARQNSRTRAERCHTRVNSPSNRRLHDRKT